MTCIRCKHHTAFKFGTYGKRRIQRYRCHSCKATFADVPAKMLRSLYTDMDRGLRRMARLTNGFSKKWENLEAAYALWFAYYNWCRVHSSLRVTPAMESGVADRIWTIAELVD